MSNIDLKALSEAIETEESKLHSFRINAAIKVTDSPILAAAKAYLEEHTPGSLVDILKDQVEVLKRMVTILEKHVPKKHRRSLDLGPM